LVHNRLRLMNGATALLFLGPLMASLGGFGWRIVPVFVAVFLLWTLIVRPSTWPHRAADWARPDPPIRLLTRWVLQVLLVFVCFGISIGRGLGGVFGILPLFPTLLPIAVSLLAIPLCRLISDPSKAGGIDRILDTALACINTAAADLPPDRSDARALASRLLTLLQALPETTPDHEIARYLQAIALHTDRADIAHVLRSAAQSGASPIGLRALTVLAGLALPLVAPRPTTNPAANSAPHAAPNPAPDRKPDRTPDRTPDCNHAAD
jgi:hypothetical protein